MEVPRDQQPRSSAWAQGLEDSHGRLRVDDQSGVLTTAGTREQRERVNKMPRVILRGSGSVACPRGHFIQPKKGVTSWSGLQREL